MDSLERQKYLLFGGSFDLLLVIVMDSWIDQTYVSNLTTTQLLFGSVVTSVRWFTD